MVGLERCAPERDHIDARTLEVDARALETAERLYLTPTLNPTVSGQGQIYPALCVKYIQRHGLVNSREISQQAAHSANIS